MTAHDELPPPAKARGVSQGKASKAQQVGGHAKQEGRQLAESAAEEARSVGETAQEQASRVAEEVTVHAGDLVSSATSQLEEQAEQQAHKLADALRGAGEQARALAEGRTQEAGDFDGYVHQVAGTLSQIAERIDGLGARGSLAELQRFARRRPGAFFAGAAAAGLVTSRFLRNLGSSSDDGDAPQGGTIGDRRTIAPTKAPRLAERVQRLTLPPATMTAESGGRRDVGGATGGAGTVPGSAVR